MEEDTGFESPQEKCIFFRFFYPAVGSIQPPFQLVLGLFIKGKSAGARYSQITPFITEVRIDRSYSSTPPVRIHDVNRGTFSFTCIYNLYLSYGYSAVCAHSVCKHISFLISE